MTEQQFVDKCQATIDRLEGKPTSDPDFDNATEVADIASSFASSVGSYASSPSLQASEAASAAAAKVSRAFAKRFEAGS